MRVRRLTAAVVSAGTALLLMSGVAEGGNIIAYHLVANPTHGVPGAAISLTGNPSGQNPPCNSDSFTITGTYPKTGGGTGTQTINGTTTSNGTISASTTVPADASPGGTITYQATIPSCSGTEGGRVDSDTATVTVDEPPTTTTASTTSTTAATTTTTAPVSVLGTAQAATPVRAQPQFTG